jgi:hypothetical protein
LISPISAHGWPVLADEHSGLYSLVPSDRPLPLCAMVVSHGNNTDLLWRLTGPTGARPPLDASGRRPDWESWPSKSGGTETFTGWDREIEALERAPT